MLIEDWFQKYEQDITSFLIYYTGSMDVEDLVQDTFLIALKKISRFKGDSHPKTWLISIARNHVIDMYRRKRVWENIKQFLLPEQTSFNEIEDHLIKKSENSRLYKAIHQLSPQYKEVVILRGILELSSKETSDILKCNQNKVNVTYHRSLKKLREILEKEGFCLEGFQTNSGTSKEPS
ncbi:RNA polymerase sigma factor [Bacillus sp. FJAT-49682]|uniref:RNA polymerase sigma factor n=1 Tax=Lederbergia citrea TaxID=2833581 RepID=A0A942UKS5_9BACI|nr:RNA polymerase sigma factor [Lederbergia citrea]